MAGYIPGENILIKEKNIQRVTNGRRRPEREQKQDSGKKIALGGGKERHIKHMYLCTHTYMSNRKHAIKTGTQARGMQKQLWF